MQTERRGTLEVVDGLVERATAVGWIAVGVLGAGAIGASTLWLAATGDRIATGGAVLWGLGSFGAALYRVRLDRLPLEVADHAATTIGLTGRMVTVRGWLGRGRRIDALVASARWEGDEGLVLPLIVCPGPLVGCFQVVMERVPDDPGVVCVAIEAREGAHSWRVEHRYDASSWVEGRFAPAVVRKQGRLTWSRADWQRIR